MYTPLACARERLGAGDLLCCGRTWISIHALLSRHVADLRHLTLFCYGDIVLPPVESMAHGRHRTVSVVSRFCDKACTLSHVSVVRSLISLRL